jgi:hypothetical protein
MLMVLAADYPFLDILWTMILFFFWIAWIWMLVVILSDVFRRDMSGWGKAAWCIFLIFLPFLGALVYLITNGSSMTERRVRDMQDSQKQFDSYVRSVANDGAGNGGPASEIAKAKSLLDSGTITEAEFASLKAKALA